MNVGGCPKLPASVLRTDDRSTLKRDVRCSQQPHDRHGEWTRATAIRLAPAPGGRLTASDPGQLTLPTHSGHPTHMISGCEAVVGWCGRPAAPPKKLLDA
jgi:hypothetical protein